MKDSNEVSVLSDNGEQNKEYNHYRENLNENNVEKLFHKWRFQMVSKKNPSKIMQPPLHYFEGITKKQ